MEASYKIKPSLCILIEAFSFEIYGAQGSKYVDHGVLKYDAI
jgi:hypothetical protein